MAIKCCGLAVVVLLFIGPVLIEGDFYECAARRLSRFVTHFEPLSYQPHRVHRDHVRLRRSINQNQHAHGHVYLRFQGFNRLFHLKLRPDTSAFHKDLVVETAQLGRITPDISHIYSGELVGEPSSHVYGALVDGVFHGAIQSPWGRYYAENARRFFPRPKAFHSVLYDARDAHFPDTGTPGGWCGLRPDTERWMDSVMRSRAKLDSEHNVHRKKRWPVRRRRDTVARWTSSGTRGPQAFADSGDLPDDGEVSDNGDDEAALNASARSAVSSTSRRVCNLKLSIDHLLYGHMHEEDSNALRTRARITAFISTHVIRASAVYRRTTFGNIQDITFIVQKIRINDSQSCAEGVKKNPFCSDGIDASYLLHLTSKENNDDFCLAYTWTFRDFADGILGLAWIARPQLGQGGICEKNRPSVDLKPGTTEYRQYYLSLNTGIMTFLNYNSPVSLSISEITFCHEIGHNFGSPHDAPPGVSCFGACAPCGSRGNYIMFPSATKGEDFNNDKFSPCSLRNITNVLKPMFEGRSNRENCFQVFGGPICGNDIVEGNEECDCGTYMADCEEKCCYPRHNTVGAPGCTLRKGEECSPSAGPCCTSNCKLLESSVLCRAETMCRNVSHCDGINATCPPGPAKPDLTPCNEGTQVCMQGECSSSICVKYGLKECTLTGSRLSADDLCLIACQGTGECLPACEFPEMKAHCGAKMTPGAPCNGLRGYCDVFRKCRDVDAEGPLTRLQRIFFGEQSVNKIKEFITLHPLLSAFLALGTLWLMILAFRCLAVHTPTSNPNKKPAHKLKDTLKQPWRL